MGKRFMVPLLIVCSLLVSVAALMGISMLWQQETLAVRDIQGSPSALEPYQVTGNWGDDFHNLSFTLSQGEIQRDVSFEKEEETPPEIEEWKAEIGGMEQYVRLELGGRILLPTEDTEIIADAGLPDTRSEIEQAVWKRFCQREKTWFSGEEKTFPTGSIQYGKGQVYMQQDVIFHEQPNMRASVVYRADENGVQELNGTACRSVWVPFSLPYKGEVTMEWTADGNVDYEMDEQKVHLSHVVPVGTVLDNKLYLTGRVSYAYREGIIGIYAYDLQELYDAGAPYNTQKRMEPEMIFGEDVVDAHQWVLGIEAVGDHLLLVKRNDSTVILETYDKAGRMLDSAEVKTKRDVYEYTLSQSAWEGGNGVLFTWGQGSIGNDFELMETSSISVDSQGKISHNFTVADSPWIGAVCGKDSFLTLEEEEMNVPGGSDFFYRGDIVPKQYFLTVYSRDLKQILYRGELITDGVDDTKGIYGAFLTKDSHQHVGKKFLVSDTWKYISGRRYFSNIEMTYTGVET